MDNAGWMFREAVVRDAPILEDAPPLLKRFVFIGWKFVLRLRLAPRGVPGTVAGWTITRTTPDSITLEVKSSLVIARKVLNLDAHRLTLTTYVWYERSAGRVLWAAIAPIHHLIEPLLLTLASRLGNEGTNEQEQR